jgi:hypothetical protein
MQARIRLNDYPYSDEGKNERAEVVLDGRNVAGDITGFTLTSDAQNHPHELPRLTLHMPVQGVEVDGEMTVDIDQGTRDLLLQLGLDTTQGRGRAVMSDESRAQRKTRLEQERGAA